jgi:ornithine decarboxylase
MSKFILSKSKVLEQYKKVEQLADTVSYSSKTNAHVTKILEQESNCLFSVHFKNELKHIQDKSRVLFLAQAWNKEEIKELVQMQIRNFVVDNIPDLEILLSFLEENTDIKINLLLRLKLKENSIRTERYFVFGISSEIINKKVKELRNNSQIEKLGVHFHRKTQNMSEWNLQYEVSQILEEEVLEMIDIMNIGGGLPSEYANTNVKVIESIFNKIKEFKSWLNLKNIQLMIEPGRFISAPAVKLITKVLRIYENNIIVNASVYNSDMDALIVPVKLKVENEVDKNNGQPYVIKGVTPCSMDLFRYRVYLKDVQEGDELIFLNAGAYNFTTNFCDLDEIETEVVE